MNPFEDRSMKQLEKFKECLLYALGMVEVEIYRRGYRLAEPDKEEEKLRIQVLGATSPTIKLPKEKP